MLVIIYLINIDFKAIGCYFIAFLCASVKLHDMVPDSSFLKIAFRTKLENFNVQLAILRNSNVLNP